MKATSEELAIFVSVVESGSFSRAAVACLIGPRDNLA